MTSSRRATIVTCFAIVYLVWGSTYLVTKIGVTTLPPFLFGAVRFIVSGILLGWVAIWFQRRKGVSTPKLTPKEWRAVLIAGLLSVAVSNGGAIWGLQYVPSNQAALLNVSSAFWIPLIGLFGARAHAIAPRVAIGLAVGFGGTVLVAWPGPNPLPGSTGPYGYWPTIAIVIGCIGWSAGTIYLRNAITSLDLMSFTALQMFCGGLMLLIPAILHGDLAQWTWDPSGLAALAYMTIVSSCIAYTAYAWLSVNVSPAQVGTFGFVNPVVATLLGWWVLDEILTGSQIVGTLVLLLGMALMNWPQKPGNVTPTVRSGDS